MLKCGNSVKAAWAIDELDQSVLKLYSEGGIDKLNAIQNIDKIMFRRIEKWLYEHKSIKEQF